MELKVINENGKAAPSMNASDGKSPGPTPNIVRPRVMWSSWMMRSATMSGL